MSINNVPTRLQTSKRDIRALGQLVKTPGAQVVFFSLLAVTGNGGTGWRYLQRAQAAKYITTDYGTSLCTPTGILAHPNTSIKHLHTRAQGTNRSNWRCVCSHRALISLQRQTQWDRSHNWNIVTKGYVLFRKDRKCNSGVALYMWQHLEHIKMLWVSIKKQISKSDTVVGVCCLPSDQQD